MRFKWWQLALVVAVAVGFMIALFVVAEVGRMRLVTAENDVRHAQSQLARVVDLYALLMNAESGYWATCSRDAVYLEPLHRADGGSSYSAVNWRPAIEGKTRGSVRRYASLARLPASAWIRWKIPLPCTTWRPVAGIKLANAASGTRR